MSYARTRSTRLRPLLMGAALASAAVGGRDAQAKDPTVAVGEVAPPPEGFGLDVTELRAAATSEIDALAPAELSARRRVVVSLATRADTNGAVTFTVNAMLRDARSGNMLAIIETASQTTSNAPTEIRKYVASEAVRSAIRRIPNALVGN